MALTPGSISVASKTATSVALTATAATGGTEPYSYQWYRSLVSDFVPGPSNEIAGATALTLEDTGLIPGTQYYYKLVVTDDATTPDEETYAQQAVVTNAPTQQPNQFAQASLLGMLDKHLNANTIPAMVDSTEAGTLYAGGAVKLVDSLGGVPKVVGCTADSDEVFGFINYDIKSRGFTAGMPLELSIKNNVMFMYSTAAIARGGKVCLDLTTNGGVAAATGSSAKRIVGWAYDKAANAGQLIRVYIETPHYGLDSASFMAPGPVAPKKEVMAAPAKEAPAKEAPAKEGKKS